MNIPIVIENKIATLATPINIVCGNSDYTMTFTFDNEWSAEPVKTARFVYRRAGKKFYQEVVFSGDTIDVPVLSGISFVLVGVYAGDLRTTTPAVIGCEKSILCDTGKHEEPEEDVYNQIIELINSTDFNPTTAILYTEQTLNESQKTQAKKNIGVTDEYIDGRINVVLGVIENGTY